MIRTREGINKKRGEGVWEIGSDVGTGKLSPSYGKVHTMSLSNPIDCWASYENCLKECDNQMKIRSRNNG